jgi:hypothetical protein
MLMVPAGPKPTDTVIVAEGETDAAWLSWHYGVDVAVLPGGADPRPHTKAFAEQLLGYSLVLLAHDADDAGHNGAALLGAELPQSRRWLPPAGANDWCSSDPDLIPPLPTPPKLLRAGRTVFVDLSTIWNKVKDPDLLLEEMPLLYTEGVHWFSGHPGSGKTTLALHISIQAMAHGRDVVWLDYEGGENVTVRKLQACGCTLDLVQSHFHYAGWAKHALDDLPAIAELFPGALVVLDSASKSLQMQGKDENSPSEVTQWAGDIVKMAKQHRLPVIVIDHVSKNASTMTQYARGASSKLADADVAWYVEKVSDFSRDKSGIIHVRQAKDREGFLSFDFWYEVGDGAGAITLAPTSDPSLEVVRNEPPI